MADESNAPATDAATSRIFIQMRQGGPHPERDGTAIEAGQVIAVERALGEKLVEEGRAFLLEERPPPPPSLRSVSAWLEGSLVPTLRDAEHRLVKCLVTTGRATFPRGGGEFSKTIAWGAVDLAAANAGRVGVFLEHDVRIERMVGKVEAMWIEDGVLWAIIRIARNALGDMVWSLISDNMPIAVSVGSTALQWEPGPQSDPRRGHRVATDWMVREVTLTIHGADAAAHVLPPSSPLLEKQILDEVEHRRNHAAQAHRASRLNKIEAAAWRAWVAPAASAIAAALGGLDAARLEAGLRAAVEAQLEVLSTP